MTTIRELLVKLGVDSDQARVERFDRALESAKGTMVKALAAATALTAGLLATAAGGATLAEELAKDANLIDQQSKLLGVSTDRYQELRYAVKQYGVDVGDLADVYAQIAGKAKDAEGGNKDAIKSFKDLGITVKDLKGLSPDGLMALLAERGGKAADQMSWLATVAKIFGEEGARQFGPLLKDGAANFNKLTKSARDLGVVMDAKTLKSTIQYHNELGRAKTAISSVKNELVLALIPGLTKSSKKTADFITANRPWIKGAIQKGVERFNATLKRGRKLLERLGGGDVTKGIERVARVVVAALGGAAVFKAGGLLVGVIKVVTGLFSGLSLASAAVAAKVAAVVAVVMALGVAFEDAITYLMGGDSLLGRWIKRAKEAGGTTGKLARAVELAGRYVVVVFKLLGRAGAGIFQRLYRIAEPVLVGIWDNAREAWDQVGAPLFDLLLNVLLGTLVKVVTGLEWLLANWDNVFGAMGQRVDTWVEYIRGVLTGVITYIRGLFDALLGQINGVLARARELPGVRNLLSAADAPTPPVATARGATQALTAGALTTGAGARQVNVTQSIGPTTLQVVQQPGEDGAALARRVVERQRATEAERARLLRSRARTAR